MILNADDFGRSHSVNRAVRDCFSKGLINRATIMVNMPAAEEAAQLARENGFFDCIGLHINLTEGKALSQACAASELCDENGFFKGVFHIPFLSRLYLSKPIRRAIYAETEAQIQRYLEMGFTLMHADSHNYTHSYFSVYSEVQKLLKKYGFKSVRISRNVSETGFSLPFKLYKSVFNRLIRNLKTANGKIQTTKYFCSVQDFLACEDKEFIREDVEFMTHPDYIGDTLMDNTLPNPHPFISKDWLDENLLYPEDVSRKKIRLLVCFIQAHIGGAMTSLVNFLNALDTDVYDVDVMFYENNGRHGIKQSIHILPQGKIHQSHSVSNVFRKALSPSYLIALLRDRYYKKIRRNKRKAVQIMSKEGCKYSRRLDKEYDIAVAYEFTWPMNYVISRVKAKKKVIWNHVEYEKSGMDFRVDQKALDQADALVFVSEDCMNSYRQKHPQHSGKLHFVPNLLSSAYVQAKGNEDVTLPFEEEEGLLKIVTVARIRFEHKGLDRAVRALGKLHKEGLADNVRWVIIGDGGDMAALKEMIHQNGLKKIVYPIGLKENPIPYLKKFDCFLLPSRHEGKPMVVTEGFIMGLVPLVTEYTSAHEQIRHGVDGLIFDNSEEGVYEGLKSVLKEPQILERLKKNVESCDYGNEKEIAAFDCLAEKLMKGR